MDNFKKLFTLPRIIFAILGIVVLIELIYAVKMTLPAAVSTPPVIKPNVQLTGGKIALVVSRNTLKVNDVIPVSVMINTGGHILDGADLIVHYDPKSLEASTSGLIRGKVFDEYPYTAVDTKAGLISISGINITKKSFNGTGLFAIISVRAKVPGKTSLTIDFKKGSTTNSNLVETGTSKNILEQVSNLELTVQ